ncbi:MAG: hypothetical protein SGPRY_012760, partial [Prymnesium sp.]
ETARPPDEEEERLISLAEASEEFRGACELALAARNEERLLEGKQPYPSIEAMIDAYMEFEGAGLGYSRARCESDVLRYLQKRSLMDEGKLDWSDPRTFLSFGLLSFIAVGLLARLPEILQ